LAVAVAAIFLLGIVWYFRREHLAGTPGSSRSESPVAVQPNPSLSAAGLPRRDAAPPIAVGKEGLGGDQVDKLIASIHWESFGGAVLAYTREQERARRERRRPNYDPQMMEVLAQNNLRMQEIAKLLGIEDLRETRFHERVWASYARGWMKALGVALTPAQDAELGGAALGFAHSRAEEAKTLQDPNRLDKLAWDAEQGLRWDETVRKLLTPDQFAEYAGPAGSDPFWGRQASRQELPLAGVEESAERVEAFWQSTLGLSENLRPLLRGAATEYVREIDRLLAGFRARYSGEAPRDEEIRLRLSLLRIQSGAEKGLAERLGLPLEQRQGLADGSGTVLDWKW